MGFADAPFPVSEAETVGQISLVSRNKHTGFEGWLSDVVDDKSTPSNITEVLLISYATVKHHAEVGELGTPGSSF